MRVVACARRREGGVCACGVWCTPTVPAFAWLLVSVLCKLLNAIIG